MYNALLASLVTLATCLGCAHTTKTVMAPEPPTEKEMLEMRYQASYALTVSCMLDGNIISQKGGSGFAVGPYKVVTADHVVDCSNPYFDDGLDYDVSVVMTSYDGDVHFAKVLKRSANDAAVLKVTTLPLANWVTVSETPAEVGDTVCMITSVPARMRKCGEVSPSAETPWMWTSILVVPGNSGSPVFNEAGEVVGIMVMRATQEYIGLAEPNSRWLDLCEHESTCF